MDNQKQRAGQQNQAADQPFERNAPSGAAEDNGQHAQGSRQDQRQQRSGPQQLDKDRSNEVPARNNQDTQNRDLNEQERENEEERSGDR